MHQLYGALQVLNKTFTEEELFQAGLREALKLTGAKIGSLFIANEENSELILKVGSGRSFSNGQEVRQNIGDGVLGYVAREKRPLLVEDIREDKRFQQKEINPTYETHSFISLPIFLHEHLIGIINLTDKESKTAFLKDDLEIMDLYIHVLGLHFERFNLRKDLKKNDKMLEANWKNTLELQETKKRLEANLEISQKMASIGKLAAGIAHELNNPLDGALRYLHLSLNHLKEGDMVREYLLEAKQGLDRMTNIVKNLLAFSRNQRLTPKSVGINEAIETVLSDLTDTSYPLRIQLIKAYHPDLPLFLDKGVDQLFTNIIKNAFEAMPQGGVLKIATKKENDEVIVRISDTGVGIPESEKESIFEPFFTTKDIDKGCGLGLAICDEIIQAYEGKIDVESKEGEGTTFIIHFPLKYAVQKETFLEYAR